MNPSRRGFAALWLVLLTLAVSGCAQTTAFKGIQGSVRSGGDQVVLLMPRDVELSLLTTGLLLEPNAAWTETARKNVDSALEELISQKQLRMVRYDEGADGAANPDHVQLIKLHEAVGRSILVHKYQPGFELPSKGKRFDWSLGEKAQALKQSYNADYALFIHFRDSFSSGGRVAANILGALIGIPVRGGQQTGFASLVDLRTGQVAWFNRLFSGAGDLRDPESARAATENLLNDLPI